jgi:hypothetical protein
MFQELKKEVNEAKVENKELNKQFEKAKMKQ